MEFKDRFKELLEENSLNIKKLCKILNLVDTTTYKYLDNSYPNIDKALTLANYFNCTLNFLAGIDDIPNLYKFSTTINKSIFFEKYQYLLNLNNISHFTFCKNAKINISSLYDWKQGVFPRLDVLIKIALNFGVSIDYLVGRSL